MKFTGYINANGNYITISEQKRMYNKYKKELKQAKEEHHKNFEKENHYKLLLYKQAREEQKKAEKQKELFDIQRKAFIDDISSKLPYNEFLIAWDIANLNRYQLEADIYRNKITVLQLKKVVDIALTYIENLKDFLYIDDLIEA